MSSARDRFVCVARLLVTFLTVVGTSCTADDTSLARLPDGDSYVLFGAATERDQFADWYTALVIGEEPS